MSFRIPVALVLHGPDATGGTCTMPTDLKVTVPAGTVLAPISVEPASWSGTLTLGGVDAGAFTIVADAAGQHSLAAAVDLTVVKEYDAFIDAVP